jgi:glycosyltransferase involved in cell wall biosynthesis
MSEPAASSNSEPRYVLVTAAYNEEAYIEKVVEAVAAQSAPPVRWIIVSDASTDRTDEIVEKYAQQYKFIQLRRITTPHARNFAAQVNAINMGFAAASDVEFDYIGNLDSDVSFESTYFARLLEKFRDDPQLGLAGGFICEDRGGVFRPRRTNNLRSVPHAVQLFRRACFEALRGYVPLPYGGPDWHAEVRCRMNGWRVRSFADLPVLHHRASGGAGGRLRSWFRQGLMDFSLGSHPVFELARLARRIPSRPYVLGAGARLCGFTWAYCSGKKRTVPDEFVKFLRAEELQRLRRLDFGSDSSN